MTENSLGMRAKSLDPDFLHGLRGHSLQEHFALGQMLGAVLARHVVAHETVHEPFRLMR